MYNLPAGVQSPRFRSGAPAVRALCAVASLLFACGIGGAGPVRAQQQPVAPVAQEWLQTSPAPASSADTSVAVDGAGNVYAYAESSSITKYDSRGTRQWTIGNGAALRGSMAVDAAGNVYFAGGNAGSFGVGFRTFKYNTNGVLQWERQHGTSGEARALSLDSAGNVYVSGTLRWPDVGAGMVDTCTTVKYDSQGRLQFAQRTLALAFPVAMTVDASGNAYILGISDLHNYRYFTVLKYNNQNGASFLEWTARFTGARFANPLETPAALVVDGAGNVYAAGRSFDRPDTNFTSFALFKCNAAGVPQWSRFSAGATNTSRGALALTLDPAGNIIVTGNGYDNSAVLPSIIKYDPSGNQLWATTYRRPDGGPVPFYGADIATDASGSIYVTGKAHITARNAGFTSNEDVVTLKLSPEGVQQWAHTAEGPAAGIADIGTSLALDETGHVYVAGLGTYRSTSADSSTKPFTLKYTQSPVYSWRATDLSTGSDSKTRLLWTRADGRVSLWTETPDGTLESSYEYGPYTGWSAAKVAVGPDGRSRLLWNHVDGRISLWHVETSGIMDSSHEFGPFMGWSCIDAATGADNKTRLLWRNTAGGAALWTVGPDGALESSYGMGPYFGSRPLAIAVTPDNKTRTTWTRPDGGVTLRTITAAGVPGDTFEYALLGAWPGTDLSVGSDGKTRVLWNYLDGGVAVWTLLPQGAVESRSPVFGPYAGWTGAAVSVGPGDNKPRVLWNHGDGRTSLWTLGPGSSGPENTFEFGPY